MSTMPRRISEGEHCPPESEIYPPRILRESLLRNLEGAPERIDGNALAEAFTKEAPPEFLGESGQRMLEHVRRIGSATPAAVVEQAMPYFQRWIAERFGSAKAVDEAARQLREQRRQEGKSESVEINDLVNYTIHEGRDGATHLALHIASAGSMLVENPLALVSNFRAAMKDIAGRLAKNPELAAVDVVSGTSPLVLRFAPTLERMGFTVERDADGSLATTGDLVKVGRMRMSRKDFLARFGE